MSDETGRLKRIEEELEAKLDRFNRKFKESLAQTETRVEKALSKQPAKPPHTAEPSRITQLEERPQRIDLLGKVDLNQTGNLRVVDDLMDADFQIVHHFGKSTHPYPTIYCETLDEFFQPHVEFLEVSASTKEALLDTLKREAEEIAPQGGIYGVNWPGRGCYLNGWLFAYGRAENALAALSDAAISPVLWPL